MTSTIQEALDNALLSQAAYADFTGLDFSNELSLIEALIEPGLGDFTEEQAIQFLDKYNVLDQYTDTGTGFSATVFQDETTGQLIFSIRGTETQDILTGPDMLTNIFGIAFLGIASDQMIEMYNYYLRLTTSSSEVVDQFDVVIESLTEPPLDPHFVLGVPDETGLTEYVILRRTNSAFGISILTNENLRLIEGTDLTSINTTGHSLGGHLAAAFSRLFPSVTENVFTYNAPGFDAAIGRELTDEIISLFSGSSTSFNSSIINSFVGEEGLDAIAGIGIRPSLKQEIYIEEAAHSIVDLADSLAVQSAFGMIDENLTLI